MRIPRSSRTYRWLVALVGVLGATFLRALGATWRMRVEGPDPFLERKPFVGVVWHQGMFIAAHHWRDRGVRVVVSRSRDGDFITAVLERLGWGAGPRGSSSRGGVGGLRDAVRQLGEGQIVAVLPDGPRGPARSLKPGAVAMARNAEVPLVVAGLSARPALRFGSWDRALLPLPFARVVCRYGVPLNVPKGSEGAEFEALRVGAETALETLTREVEAGLGTPALPPGGPTPELRDRS